MIRYEVAFATNDAFTRAALSRMTSLSQTTRVCDKLGEHIEYAQLCVQLFSTILDQPQTMSSTSQPLWWIRGDCGCNCFYFEIITAVIDAASLFVTQEEPAPTLQEGQSVVWLLNWIIERAFPNWTDGAEAKQRKHYKLEDACKLYAVSRAYCFFLLFLSSDRSPTQECIQSLSFILHALTKYGPCINFYIASQNKMALVDGKSHDWGGRAKIEIYSMCKVHFENKGEFGLSLACTRQLASMGHVASKEALSAEEKDYVILHQNARMIRDTHDVTNYILNWFKYKGKAFRHGKAPDATPLRII